LLQQSFLKSRQVQYATGQAHLHLLWLLLGLPVALHDFQIRDTNFARALCWQVWAVKAYVPRSVPVYVQVLQRASLRMLQPFLDPDRDVLISVEQIRHRLLALSCLCPGASTLIGARTHELRFHPTFDTS
jgi:hypothetical protein